MECKVDGNIDNSMDANMDGIMHDSMDGSMHIFMDESIDGSMNGTALPLPPQEEDHMRIKLDKLISEKNMVQNNVNPISDFFANSFMTKLTIKTIRQCLRFGLTCFMSHWFRHSYSDVVIAYHAVLYRFGLHYLG